MSLTLNRNASIDRQVIQVIGRGNHSAVYIWGRVPNTQIKDIRNSLARLRNQCLAEYLDGWQLTRHGRRIYNH